MGLINSDEGDAGPLVKLEELISYGDGSLWVNVYDATFTRQRLRQTQKSGTGWSACLNIRFFRNWLDIKMEWPRLARPAPLRSAPPRPTLRSAAPPRTSPHREGGREGGREIHINILHTRTSFIE